MDISNPNAPVLVREGQIADPSFDFYYGSIAANANGDFVIGFNRSGPAAARLVLRRNAFCLVDDQQIDHTFAWYQLKSELFL